MYVGIQLDVTVETGAGRDERDEANPAGMLMHNMKKLLVVESGVCGQDKLENNELCKRSGPGEELMRR